MLHVARPETNSNIMTKCTNSNTKQEWTYYLRVSMNGWLPLRLNNLDYLSTDDQLKGNDTVNSFIVMAVFSIQIAWIVQIIQMVSI